MNNLEIKTTGKMTEEDAKDLFAIYTQDSDEFYDFLIEHYLAPEDNWKQKEYVYLEEFSDEVFDWLFDKYPEEMLIAPVQAAYLQALGN